MSETVCVTASLVGHLRKGLRFQLGFAAERLARCLLELGENEMGDEYKRSLALFDAGRRLYEQVNSTDESPSGVDLDISANAVLVLRALECQYNVEVDRIQEVKLYGPDNDAGRETLRSLRNLIAVVAEHAQEQGAVEPFLSAPPMSGHEEITVK